MIILETWRDRIVASLIMASTWAGWNVPTLGGNNPVNRLNGDALSTYPRDEAWNFHLSLQKDRMSRGGKSCLVKLLSFPRGTTWVGLCCEVEEEGKIRTFGQAYNRGWMAERSYNLEPGRKKDLLGYIGELPPSDPPPPLNKLLIISHFDGKHWMTHIYNINIISPKIRSLLTLLKYKI
jgi:hypothetical protein